MRRLHSGHRQRVFLVKGQELYVVTAGELVEGLRIQAMDKTSIKLVDQRTSAEAVLLLTQDEHGVF